MGTFTKLLTSLCAILALGFCSFATAMGPSAGDPQECDSFVLGGTIRAGSYSSGAEPGPLQALVALNAEMGLEAPECAGCEAPLFGCSAGVQYDPTHVMIDIFISPATGRAIATAEVGEDVRWFKTCTPCVE